MKMFLAILSCAFFFATHCMYKVLFEKFINNTYINIAVYLGLFLLSQSYMLLLNKDINRYLEYFLYIVVFCYCNLFFYYLIMSPIRFFYPQSNAHLIDYKVIIFLVFLGIYGFFNRYWIRTTTYNIKTNKDINLKIAFISDLHIGDTGINEKILTNVKDKINRERVDIIILGGDIVEQYSKYFVSTGLNNLFHKMNSKYGIYAILGNHEYYGGDRDGIVRVLKDNNIKVLIDSYEVFKDFILVGRNDITQNWFSRKRLNINSIIEEDKIKDNTIYKIVVDHNPAFFNESVSNNIDLQLSGHTHNGQFFPFNIIVKFFYKKAYGKLKTNNSILITSSGLSTWRIPIKLFSKPEIVMVNIGN